MTLIVHKIQLGRHKFICIKCPETSVDIRIREDDLEVDNYTAPPHSHTVETRKTELKNLHLVIAPYIP